MNDTRVTVRLDDDEAEQVQKLSRLDYFDGWTDIAKAGLRMVWAKYGAFAEYVDEAHSKGAATVRQEVDGG